MVQLTCRDSIGFSTLLSEQSPTQIHGVSTYSESCTGSVSSVVESASLFSLLNDIEVFLRESYKHIQKWEEMSQGKYHSRLCPIGETRWWAQDQTLTKVFGCFGNAQDDSFVDLLMTLATDEEDRIMKPTITVKAKGYREV